MEERSAIRRDELTLGEELCPGHLACRLPDGREAILRTPPSPEAGRVEIVALRAWEGRFAPDLLDADETGTALLLERIYPGTPAPGAAAEELAICLRGLHVSPPTGVPPLDPLVREQLAAATGTAQRLAWAHAAIERLATSAPEPVLLHGALGPSTLLRCARRGLCAVGPHPCAGDAAFDTACWIHAHGAPGRRARFEALAHATGGDRARLRDWCGLVAVLAASFPRHRVVEPGGEST